jgi:hypothetical protein
MPYERYNDFNNPRNTTSLEDLAEPIEYPNTDKFIRSHHNPPINSGMYSHEPYDVQPVQPPQPPQQREHSTNCSCSACASKHTIPVYNEVIMCPSIFEHISSCPVCRKLYGRDNENVIYIVIIIILLVACGLLFKKAFYNH